LFWAHFRREAPETGLSAPIPRLSLRESLRDFRFNPLRVRHENAFPRYENGKRSVKRMLRFHALILA
jgi:hypothetical protein